MSAHPTAPQPLPDESTAAAAIGVLEAELALANGNIDSIDGKAVLIPPFIVALAAFIVGQPPFAFSPPVLIVLALALMVGLWSTYLAYLAVAPSTVNLGPKASLVIDNIRQPAAVLNEAMARSLADAVQKTSERTVEKGKHLDGALRVAGVTILLLVFARLIGDFH